MLVILKHYFFKQIRQLRAVWQYWLPSQPGFSPLTKLWEQGQQRELADDRLKRQFVDHQLVPAPHKI